MAQISAKEAIKNLSGEYTSFTSAIQHIKRLFPFSDVDGSVKEPKYPTITTTTMTPMIIGAGEALEGFYIDKDIDWDKTKPGKCIYKYTISPKISKAMSFMFMSTIPNNYMIDPTLKIES